MFTFQALQILIFLIPGFIASVILDVLVIRKIKKDLGKIIEALIFTLIIYSIYSAILHKSPVDYYDIDGVITYEYNARAFLWLLLISAAVPIIIGLIITHDWHMKLFRWLKISKNTGRTAVWFDVFYSFERYIIINFKDERRIIGWPMYYADDPKAPYIFLWNPSWIENEEYLDIDAEGILITPNMEIDSIEFLKENI